MENNTEILTLVMPPEDSGKEPKNKRKRRKSCTRRCLVLTLIYILIMAAIAGAAIGASNFAFNTYVAPRIGGVQFFSAMRLMRGLYAGESNRKKILTDTAGPEDLETFYDQLYTHLFIEIKSESELKATYATFSDEEKAAVLADLMQDEEWKAKYEAAKESDKAAMVQDYYVETHRYPLTVSSLLSTVNISELTAAASAQQDATVAAAEEGESTDMTETLKKLLNNLSIDFKNNAALAAFDYTKDADYPANVEAVSMILTGKQITALLNEVLTAVLSNMDMSALNEIMGEGGEEGSIPNINLGDYIRIPQVMIKSEFDSTGMTAAEIESAFDKNVCLKATVEMRIDALLQSPALLSAMQKTIGEATGRPALATIVMSTVRSLLPKTLFITVGIYPNDPDREMVLQINNYSGEDQANLIAIVNSTMGDNIKILDDETYNAKLDAKPVGEDGQKAEFLSIFEQVNIMTADLFGKLDELGIPLTFRQVEEGKPDVGLTLAHVQLLLHFLQLDGEDGVTAYDFMTVLKCLFSDPDTSGSTPASTLNGLYGELEQKFGIPTAYWADKSFFDAITDTQSLVKQIHLSDVTFAENSAMRVTIHDNEMVKLVKDLIGSLGDSSTAAAEEGEDDNIFASLKDALTFSEFSIAAVPGESNLYSLTCKVSLGVADLLGNVLKDEDGITNTLKKAFPDNLSLGLVMYMGTEDNVVKTYSPQGHPIAYTLNSFDTTYTSRVLDTVTKVVGKLNGSEMDLTSLSDRVSEGVSGLFDNVNSALNCDLRLVNGGIQLPSLYEVIRGIGISQTKNNDLTEADVPDAEAIRNVLNVINHYTPSEITVYDGTDANALLASLQSKYYLKSSLTVNDLFAEGSNLADKFSGNDFINMQGMYQDTRSISELSIPIEAKALADLVQQSGRLDDISVEGLVQNVSIVDSRYTVEGDNLYLTLVFRAALGEQESSDNDFSVSSFLPEALYLSAKILVHNSTDTYGTTPRFGTGIIFNESALATADLLRLVKVFTGTEVDTSSVGNTVKDALTAAFDTVEGNLNVSYSDKMVISDVFTYLADGKLTTDGGKTTYNRSQYMVDIDISGIPDYYDTHTKETDPNYTGAETLMLRMRELGKGDSGTAFANQMYVWQGGKPNANPASNSPRYNDNQFTAADETDFYEQLQAYYFFKSTPNSTWFNAGSDIFGNLSASNLDEYFNLSGMSVSFTGADVAQKTATSSKGLYYYEGDQYNVKLSDKAIGSLIKTQAAVSVESDFIESVEVTSFKLGKIGDTMQVDITTKITTKGNALMPSVFYLSATSTADWTQSTKSFSTSIGLNRFTEDDLDAFLNNTGFLGTINIKDSLDTDKVKNSISSALNSLFNEKLGDYIADVGNYTSGDSRGKGYLEFYNVYHEIVDTLGIDRDIYTNADVDIQGALTALYHDNTLLYNTNPSSGSETVGLTKVTDRAFANCIKEYLDYESKSPESVQSIIFAGTSSNAIFTDWQNLLAGIGENENFAFTTDSNYIVTTAKFNTADLGASMSLLPQYIYTTLVIDGNTKDVVYSFFNDMTDTQTGMLLSKMTGNTDKTQLASTVQSVLNSFVVFPNYAQNTDPTFADYVGCLKQ